MEHGAFKKMREQGRGRLVPEKREFADKRRGRGAHLDPAPGRGLQAASASERHGSNHRPLGLPTVKRHKCRAPSRLQSGVVSSCARGRGRPRPILERSLRHERAWLISLIVLLGAGFFAPTVQAQAFKENDLKAAFLYHLTQFVEWPPEVFPTEETPLVIGILGADPFGKTLDDIVQDETVKNRKLAVRRFQSLEEVKGCHILFISQSEAGRLDQIFSGLKARKILTVGDTEGFAQRGGMVRFINEKSKIRLRINIEAAKAAGLTISSKLLRAAELVGAKAGEP